MAPRKNRPVLFEVISRTQRSRPPKVNLPRPTPAGGPPAAGAAPGPGTPPPAAPGAPAPSGSPGETPAKPAMITKFRTSGVTTSRSLRGAAAGPAARRGGGWLAITETGRISLSLGWQELAIAGVVIVVFMVGAYLLGYRAGHAGAPPLPESSTPAVTTPDFMKQPAPAPVQERPRLVPDPTPGQNRTARVETPRGPSETPPPAADARPVAPPPPAPAAKQDPLPEGEFQPQEGTYYVVAQHFPPRYRKQAEEVRDFLRSKGLNAVVRSGDRDLELVLTEAFASEQQASAAVQRVRELGKEFNKAGGGYDLAGARARKQ